jgi:protein-tyrosine-phosphatase
MKLLFGKSRKEAEVKSQEEKIVLFVCVENAGRSQIAEAFFRKYAPRGYMTVSAGTRPVGEINPVVIQAMKGANGFNHSYPRKIRHLNIRLSDAPIVWRWEKNFLKRVAV